MRQTNIFRLCHSKNKLMLCIMILFFSCITSIVFADIAPTNVAVKTTFPGGGGEEGATSNNRINGAGSIGLEVTWQGDSPPFTARYKKGSTTIFSDSNIRSNQHSATITAAQWGDTAGASQNVAVEIVDSAGRSGTANSQSFIIDTLAPQLTATVTNGPNFSQTSSVRIQINSNEIVSAPTVTSEGVAATMEGSLTSGNSFVYNLQLTSAFGNGPHTITVTAKDVTVPAASANSGTTTVTFNVGTTASGNTTIASATPGSPTNSASVQLSGTAPEGVAKVTLLDGATEVTSVNSNKTEWTLTIQPSEGSHSYVAVSYDALNQEISRSAPMTYVVDRTAPKTPKVESTDLPAQTNSSTLAVSVSVEGYNTEVTPPVSLLVYVNNDLAGSPYNITTAGSPINVNVPLTDGSNSITFKTVDAAGNESPSTAAIVVNKSGVSTASVTTLLVDTYSVPAPSSVRLGPGSHTLVINFNQAVASDIPTVEITCGGGSKIPATAAWGAGNMVLNASFTVPNNGGVVVDGAATISITGVKDSFGNTIKEYVSPSAFSIDSTPPTSTFEDNSTVYVSSNTTSLTLRGTVSDSEGGSGVDFLELFEVSGTGTTLITRIPLQTGAQSPWTYNYDASALGPGDHTFVTGATDRAVPIANVESVVGKTGKTLTVDKSAPEVTRISLNNTGENMPIGTGSETMRIASDVTRIVAVASDTGSGLDLTSSNYIFTLSGPNGEVKGEKTNNNRDTIYFDFPVLTAPGTYTINVIPIDKAGNTGENASRTFVLDKSAPDTAEFSPYNQCVTNETNEDLAQSQVRVTLSTANGGAVPSYERSTISVKYNGLEVGEKVASEGYLISKLHGGNLDRTGSGKHDGNYYITVVPYSNNGIAGSPINSSFIYDTVPPVVIETTPPNFMGSETVWIGKDDREISITVSDSPKDIIEHSPYQFGATAPAVLIPGDVTWYNGSGSGFNVSLSSFTCSIGSGTEETPSTGNQNAFRVEGNKLTLTRPGIPEDTSAGVADINVKMYLCDNATSGTQVPNVFTTNRYLKFDYASPEIQVASSGLRFCKNELKVEASASDQGTSEDLKVTKIEYYEEGVGTWTPMIVNNIPAKSASFTLKLDITNKKDGTYTIKFRAVDRAGNMSAEKTYSYVVDRTPPDPPELTIPLADYTVNKRTQSFKWVARDGVNGYLFQVSDDSSFNNILNAQANANYSSLKGTVCYTTDAVFSLPKDGTYYWRVASIEKCEDGYNVSAFSETRKVIIDSVKPYILSITPTPSSSNVVSTGMVTFSIRFNEPLDSTIDLSANLTSAGGQLMKIEKISCTGDTWTGTTVIPKNNSALYDGNAVISVEGATDLAGNMMANDSSHTIVVNTGPAFTTKLFSNPANEYEITIITKSSESLQTAPSVHVKQNSVKTPVTMNFLKDRFYSGSYKIDKESPGSAYISLSGTDLYGMVGNSTVEFVVADLNASARLNVTAANGRATLKAAEGATFSPTSVFIIGRDTLEPPFNVATGTTTTASLRASAGVRASSNNNSELVGVLGLDEVGPSTVKLKKCMLYTADINGEVIDTTKSNKIHIYRQDSKGNWIFQGGELKDYKISAQLTGLGRLALMMDTTSPKVSSLSPANNAKLDTNLPEIKGQFVDNGSGLVAGSFRLYIDGLQVKNVELQKDGSFTYQVKQTLKEGKHEIKCEVSDRAGNSIVRAVTVDAPAPIRIGEFRPYPSPARGNRISFAYNFGAVPTDASLKVYDSAGHLVAKFGNDDFDRASGLIRWDLTNHKGKRIANGTYIYRLEVTANGQKTKLRGKFAVLR